MTQDSHEEKRRKHMAVMAFHAREALAEIKGENK